MVLGDGEELGPHSSIRLWDFQNNCPVELDVRTFHLVEHLWWDNPKLGAHEIALRLNRGGAAVLPEVVQAALDQLRQSQR